MAVRPSRAAGLIAGCAVLVGIAAAPAATAQNNTATGGLAAVEGSVPSWATPAARVGHADPAQQRHIQVALALRAPAGAEALAKAVSTPGSKQFGHHLSNAEFVARYAPIQQTVDQVTTWLRSQGLRVTGVAGN